jgi:hypothetical protein
MLIPRIQNGIPGETPLPDSSNDGSSLEDMMKQTLNDPIVRILINGSNLTSIQFQTFLIDHIIHHKSTENEKYGYATHFRLDKKHISRGSFNRTLSQATRNIIRSIYTVFLLGYVGIFDTPILEPFIEASSEIRAYLDRLRSLEEQSDEEKARAVATLSQELNTVIENLAGVRRLRNL